MLSEATILDYTVKAMILVLVLSMPPILVATAVGLIISLVQALTQIQEQTLPFAVKLVAVVATLIFTANFLGGEMFNFTKNIFDNFPTLVK